MCWSFVEVGEINRHGKEWFWCGESGIKIYVKEALNRLRISGGGILMFRGDKLFDEFSFKNSKGPKDEKFTKFRWIKGPVKVR